MNDVYQSVIDYLKQYDKYNTEVIKQLYDSIQKDVNRLSEQQAKELLAASILDQAVRQWIAPIAKLDEILKGTEKPGEELPLNPIDSTLSKCRKGSTVAFKSKKDNQWFTGCIIRLYEPNSKYNKENTWMITIQVHMPVEPQWLEEGDTTMYFYDDISNIILIENPPAEE